MTLGVENLGRCRELKNLCRFVSVLGKTAKCQFAPLPLFSEGPLRLAPHMTRVTGPPQPPEALFAAVRQNQLAAAEELLRQACAPSLLSLSVLVKHLCPV